MRISDRSVVEVIDLHAELLENINRRLEEMQSWRVEYPQRASEITALCDEAVRLGMALQNLDFTDSAQFADVTKYHDRFFVNYEHLWLSISSLAQ